MSAEKSIRTYDDATLLGAHNQLSNHGRAHMKFSWEGERLLLLAKELRMRKLTKESNPIKRHE